MTHLTLLREASRSVVQREGSLLAWLRKVGGYLGLFSQPQEVADTALRAVEQGWAVYQVPGHVLLPRNMVTDWVPHFVDMFLAWSDRQLRHEHSGHWAKVE